MGKERFSVLDSWRGIAALTVAIFHLSAAGHFYPLDWIRQAGLFVDFFFLLSGFVMTHGYLEMLNSAGDVSSFIIKRFGRLWPLHIFTLGMLVLLELAKLTAMNVAHLSAGERAFSGATSLWALITNIFLIHSLGLHDTYTWNGPSWSISVEFWTYMLFATVARYFRGQIAAVSFLIMALSVMILLLSGVGSGSTYDFGIFRCFYNFFAGVLVYLIYAKAPQSQFPAGSMWEWLAFLALVLFVSSYRFIDLGYAKPFVFGFVVLTFARERGLISRWLLSKPLRKLGAWSYSIYLVHFVVLTLLNSSVRVVQQITKVPLREEVIFRGQPVDMINLGHSPFLNDALALVFLAIVIFLSSLTYRYIEDPARHYFNAFARTNAPALLPVPGESGVGLGLEI